MKVYNTLTRKKEELIAQDPSEFKMYVCGPTVYNYIHIGNARPFVVFDTMRKYLQYKGVNVKFVQNFTDVDDKIIKRAKEEGITAFEVGDKYIKAYFEDVKALNITPADVHPRVTETMPEIIAFVKGLVDKGMAYEANGDVYYRTRKFPGYGKLSGKNIDDLQAGARIEVGDIKEDPMDFALWKARKEESEIAWESPWGMGRPGWHIECSAMNLKYLGETIDLHCGGEDLQFPHHENEIAQTEGLTGKTFSNYWMHNGFINIDGEKMSKSANNFFLVRDILKEYEGEVLRYFLLSAQYRGPINFARDLMDAAKNSLERMRNCKENLKHIVENGAEGTVANPDKYNVHRDKFVAAMDDDLNTADAITAIFELVSDINKDAAAGMNKAEAAVALKLLDELTAVLGLLRQEKEAGIDPEIQKLVDERQAARKAKDFARADAIRDELAAKGITLKDTKDGVQIIKN